MDTVSDTLLLSTKLKIPMPRRDYVVRRALFDKLSKCADLGVVFVRGGAGTGKTTLLSSFIRETGMKNVGWLSLDAANANVYSFWLYFTAAVNTFLSDDDDFLALLRANPDALHMERLLTILINRLCGEEDYFVVLDDVHCLKDAALIRTLEFFLNAMPENLHLFMLSREDPPVYLGPLAVSGRLLFIDGKQMELTPEEGMAFLKQTLRFSGSEEELKELNAYAEGWIGGLQLAAAAEAMGRNPGELLRAGGGIAAEYLTREIFESLTQDERIFLMGTGYLSYFDAAICGRIFGGFSKEDFDAMITGLTEKNLFILCVDEHGGVYRYHNILSEYLTQQFSRLPEDRKKVLLEKSAAAFENRGDYEEAMRQYCSAGDYRNLMRTAHKMGGSMEAWSYLNKVPLDSLMEDVDLAAQCFIYNIGSLDIERCRALYEQFKKRYGNTDIFRVMQFAEAYISKGDGILPEYCALTAEQVDALPLGPATKAMIYAENAAALLDHMQYEEAEKQIETSIRTCAGRNPFTDLTAYDQKAQIYEETGRLNDSLACYEKADEILKIPAVMTGIGSNYYIGLTGVYLRRMELPKAGEALRQARMIVEKQRSHIDVMDMTLAFHLAELEFLSGRDRSGASYVNGLLSEYPHFSVLTMGRLIHELSCASLLSPELAASFLRELETAKDLRLQPFMRLLRARLLFERGEKREALRETEEVLVFARSHHNRLRLVEAGLQKIWMLARDTEESGGRREIGNLLREAVYYSYENRILMPFFLDRRTLLPYLCKMAAQPAGKSGLNSAETVFVRDAIALCGGSGVSAAREREILSARELDVLSELAGGITNREIAEKLCISQATVKTHVLSIFGKLGVSSRLMAVEEGRKRGLLR